MGKLIKKIPIYIIRAILLTANTLSVLAMLVCAYSQYIKPQDYPQFSYYGMIFPAFLVTTVLFLIFWLTVKWRYALLSAAGLLLCASTIRTFFPVNLSGDPPEDAIKILSYNTLNLGACASRPWKDSPVVDYLVKSDADIVCLQESAHTEDSGVDSILGTVYPYRESLKYRGDGFVCLSKHPILRQDTIYYPSITNASVAYDILVGKDTLLVISNHFESFKLQEADREEYKELIVQPRKSDARQTVDSLTAKLSRATALRGVQADSVASLIERNKHRSIIVCGDFNDAPVSYVHYRMTRWLNDAYTRSGNGMGHSYNRSGMYFRIDNILCSPDFKAYGAKVDTSISTSDHYPIYCWLKKRE